MSTATTIEWTEKTWNPCTGCTKVSLGCKHCYAETIADRFWATQYPPMLVPTEHGETARPRQFTDVQCHEDRLSEPLGWRKPVRVFVNSMSDLFHEDVPDAFIDRVFAIMALAQEHTFQVLTKRPARMLEYLSSASSVGVGSEERVETPAAYERVRALMDQPTWVQFPTSRTFPRWMPEWPLPNVWLGVSCENQATADERIPLLLRTPAAVRFISAEPLLGPVDLCRVMYYDDHSVDALTGDGWTTSDHVWLGHPFNMATLNWVIAGSESGPGARPMNEEWVRAIRNQCQSAGVAFFYKQKTVHGRKIGLPELDGRQWSEYPDVIPSRDGRRPVPR